MDLDSLIIAVFCLVDDTLRRVAAGRLRRRGPRPTLSDAEVLTIEVVGEHLGPRAGMASGAVAVMIGLAVWSVLTRGTSSDADKPGPARELAPGLRQAPILPPRPNELVDQ